MDAKIQEVLDMYAAEVPVRAIAQEMGISEGTVRKIISDNVEEAPKWNSPPEDVVIAAYKEDVPVPNILREYNLNYTRLYNILNKHKIPLRKTKHQEVSDLRMKQAVQMYKDGELLYKITQETGIAQPALHAELHAQGVPLRRPRRKR